MLRIRLPFILYQKQSSHTTIRTANMDTITKLNTDLPRRFSRKPSYNSMHSQASSANSSLPRISECSGGSGSGILTTSRSNVFDRLHPSPLISSPASTPKSSRNSRAQVAHTPRIRGGEDVNVVDFERSVFKCRTWLSTLPDRFYGLESTLFERALRNTSMSYDVTMQRSMDAGSDRR